MIFVKILLMIWLWGLGMVFYRDALKENNLGICVSLIMAIVVMVGICLL